MGLCLIPIGPVDDDLLRHLQIGANQVTDSEVTVAKPIAEPTGAYNHMRKQYGAVTLLPLLAAEQAQHHYTRALGVIDRDLFHHELDFVFVHLVGTIGVVGLARLRPEFEGQPADLGVFRKRALSATLHTVGRLYRLEDCIDRQCVMFPARSVQDMDRQGAAFCPKCRAALQ